MPAALYIFITLLVLYLIMRAYIRVTMKFWHLQPVFHYFNLGYWLRPPGQITAEPVPANKYLNLINNKFIKLAEADDRCVKRFCNFVKDYYVTHASTRYSPTPEDLLHNALYINLYQEPVMLFEKGVPLAIPDEEILAVISARTLNVSLKNRQPFLVYYIDNLCVKTGYRKKDIAPQVIQSFCHKLAQTKIQVNLFKREGQLNAIVPLVHFDTHCFDISQFRAISQHVLPPAMNLIELTTANFNLLFHFLKIQTKQFDCVVLPEVANLFNMLKLGKLIIYGLLFKAELATVYIFRPLALTYGGEKKAIECIAIISTSSTSTSTSVGFNLCLPKLQREILWIEATAHSREIIANLQENPFITCNTISKTAFFFYNYACHTCASDKTLLVY